MSTLRRNAAWALAGNTGYAACQWGILMAIAKHAAPAEVGRFALAIAVTSPIVMLTNLQLRAVQATDAQRRTPFAAYFGLRLLSIGVAWLAITLVAAANGYDRSTAALVAAMALAKGVEALADVVFGLQQQHENLRRIALSMLLKGVGSVVIVALLVARTGALAPAVLAMAAWWALVLVAIDLRGAARLTALRPVLRAAVLTPLAWLALPLGLVMGINSFAVNVPRYTIAAQLGPAALGYFAAAAYLLVAASQPMMALGAALSPRLARLYHDDRDAYRRLALRGLAAAAALGSLGIVAAALFGRQFLTLAYAPDYAAHYDLLLWLAVVSAVGFVSTGLGVAVTAARRFPVQLATAVASLVLGAAASTVLVPAYGLVGGALALLLTELTRLICLATVFWSDCYAGVEEGDARGGSRCKARASEGGGVAGLRLTTERASNAADGPAARVARAARVLHVFGSMNRGGAETRTLEIMRRIDGDAYRFEFCVLSGNPGSYALEIAALGGTTLPCALPPLASFPLRFLLLLRRGRYDVVHSHVHQFSGVILLLARLAGVRTRIAHLRSAHDGRADSARRRVYRALMRRLVDRSATTVIGVSASAMTAFWGGAWEHDARRHLIYDGIEVGQFGRDGDPSPLRRTLAIAPDARVVMHIGSFSPAKNHAALVAIAAALTARRRDVVFVLVGDGALRPAIEAAVARSGLTHFFRFTGNRADVPALLRTADVVVLPSHWEGLPGVVLEALASGPPVVASPIGPVLEIAARVDGIRTADPADPHAFARAVDETLRALPSAPPAPRVLPAIFATETSMQRLLECYR